MNFQIFNTMSLVNLENYFPHPDECLNLFEAREARC